MKEEYGDSNQTIGRLNSTEPTEVAGVKAVGEPVLPGVDEVRSHKFTHQFYRIRGKLCSQENVDDVPHMRGDGQRRFVVLSMGYTYFIKNEEGVNIELAVHDDGHECVVVFAVLARGGIKCSLQICTVVGHIHINHMGTFSHRHTYLCIYAYMHTYMHAHIHIQINK